MLIHALHSRNILASHQPKQTLLLWQPTNPKQKQHFYHVPNITLAFKIIFKKKKTSQNPHYYLSLGYKSLLRRRHSFPRHILSVCFYFLSFFQKCNNYVLTPTTDEDPWWHAFSTVFKKMYVKYSAIMILSFKSIIAIIHFLG